jgi:hypothetical protein
MTPAVARTTWTQYLRSRDVIRSNPDLYIGAPVPKDSGETADPDLWAVNSLGN